MRPAQLQILRYLALAGPLLLWAFAIYIYSSLPATIATHFNFNGQPDGFGSRNTIFLLPAIFTVIIAALILLSFKPQWHNYSVTLTPTNRHRFYTLSSTLIVSLSFSLTLTGIIITYYIWQSAIHTHSASMGLSLAIISLVILGPLVWYFIKAAAIK